MFLVGLAMVVFIMTGLISLKYGCSDSIRKSVSVKGGSKMKNIQPISLVPALTLHKPRG